ncbi:MAG: DUF3015 domain-containing protein [Gammaproteobacteria bacterium]|nr:DUF3015 domain-containing protein [Gammaproteobacteria bacterium]
MLISAVLFGATSSAFAVAPGGPDCGWGNMLLEGKNGLVMHMLAGTTNGTSGNATFGMTFGTNGCSVDGALTYGGEKMVWFDNILDQFSTDVAQGNGEALNAVAVMMGVEANDRAQFDAVMHDNFTVLFPSETVTSQEVLDAMIVVMKQDQTLSKYVA